MENKKLYYTATTTAVLLWSASFIATKVTYTVFAPQMTGFIRSAVAAVILGIVRLLQNDTVRPEGTDLHQMAMSGLLGITLYFAAENTGVQLTSASNAALIVASFPAMTALLEFLLFRIRPTFRKICGISFAFFGVAILTTVQNDPDNSRALIGNLILVLAGVIWAFYNFSTRTIAEKYSPVTLSYYQTLFGTVFLIPFVLLERGTVQTITLSGVLAMLYLAIGCSVLAFLLYNFGLRKLSAATSISLMNLVPVFGLIFSAALLHETITLRQIIGGTVVIAGVVLSTETKTK